MKNKIPAISFAVLLPFAVAIGAYIGTVTTPLLLIGAICAVVILVALKKISGKIIYFYLFGISLGLLYQTTMMGVDVVGSDIHNELYYARLNTLQTWNYNLSSTDNASFVIWFIAPFLSKLLMIDIVWVFKAVLPIFLMLVPLVLFSVLKRQFGGMRAFFATTFFMIIPAFSMEAASIAKTMVAELFLALMVWVMVSNWKWQYKTLGVCGALIMQAVCHYTVGVLGLLFLLGVFLVRLITNPLKWRLFANRKVPLLALAVCLIIGCGAFWGYHSFTAEGSMAKSVASSIFRYAPVPPDSTPSIIPIEPTRPTEPTEPVISPSLSWFSKDNWLSFAYPRSNLVNTAIGLDFMDVPIDGKAFRIVQFLTQLMIIMGTVRLFFFERLDVTAEFVGFIIASGMVLAACIFVVGFADILNATRFYHFTLFFLSPMFVLGCETLGKIKLDRKND